VRALTATRVGIVLLLLCERPTAGQPAAADPVRLLLARLQLALDRDDAPLFASLFSEPLTPEQIEQHRRSLVLPGATRHVVREIDRAPLEGVPRETGHRVAVEVFEETPGRARIVSTSLAVRRGPDGGPDSWRIVGADGLNEVSGLYRLRVETTTQYAARQLEIRAPDLALFLEEGTVFQILSNEGVTGLVLLGRGEMRFAPTPATERGQLRLFAGRDTLITRFDSVLIRLNPLDYPSLVPPGTLRRVDIEERAVRRAVEVAARELPRSFSVDLRAVSPLDWHVLPRQGDVLAEIRTSRHGVLTYSRFGALPEDVSLVRREPRLTISLYRSAAQIDARGHSHEDDDHGDFDIIDYDIDASVSPTRRFLRARASMHIRARTTITTLTLRLSDALTVAAVSSSVSGAVGFVRLKNQQALQIRLPRPLTPESSLTLTLRFSGTVQSQPLEGTPAEGDPAGPQTEPDPHLLLSSASDWYPQNLVIDYATATLRITVPEGYRCLATGELDASGPAPATDADGRAATTFVFHGNRPLRYLALLVGRFVPVETRTLPLAAGGAPDSAHTAVTVYASPRVRGLARDLATSAEDILRLYASIMGDIPFPSISLALVESGLPGGHSPAYFAILNSPTTPVIQWRSDPAAFPDFPEFVIAHELAHQWWGHAVGWKNYHEQWISEGFAQYFAAMYAQKLRGDRALHDMLRQFHRGARAESSLGPVHLGQRLGHIKGGPRAHRALVYNKGAAVLHMLRRMTGDPAFFAGLRRVYTKHAFQTAGTDDVRRAFEMETGRPLERFFDRWIYGTNIPRVTYRIVLRDDMAHVRLEQQGDVAFDLPVTLTLMHADGQARDVVVVMNGKTLDDALPAKGVRQVRVNRDSAALAVFEAR
jgi:hypothetical protein